MLCSNCGLVMLTGFKFCHHCGTPINVVTAAPELTVTAPPERAEEPPGPVIADAAAETAEDRPREADGGVSAGRMYILDLLCYIPVLNFILLTVMAAAGRGSPMREIARGKLLALVTALLVFLFAVLILVLLMYMEIIEPIYLGRWRT